MKARCPHRHARKSDCKRRIIIKAEVTRLENRTKELHHGMQIDRTSCSRFLANFSGS